MKHKILLALTLLLLLSPFSTELFAQPNLNVIVGGKNVIFNQSTGYPFVDANERTLVPLRSVAEASGASVSWDANRAMAVIKNQFMTLEVPIGVPKIYKNGYPMHNDTSAILKNGRTYLPIRKILELMNYDVLWFNDPPTIEAYKQDDNFAVTKSAKLPASYDLRKVNKVGEVRDQLQTQDCWAFASSALLQSKLLPGENIVFSPRHLRDYSTASSVYKDGGGTMDIAASYYLNWIGPVKEQDYPFDGLENLNFLKPVKHVMGMRRIADKDYTAIKKAIMEHGAVYSAILGENEANEANMINYDTSSQNYTGLKDQDHAVAIVGWDDNYPKEKFLVRPRNNGAFIVMNSYGKNWGDKGFYYVSYEDLHIGTYCNYYTDVEPSDNYDNLYTTDDYGPTNWLTFYENKAIYSNVFTPRGNETVEAIGIYSLNSNANVEVYMLPNFKDISSFKTIKPVFLTSAYLKDRGFHTIKVMNSPPFNSRTAFMVKASTTDEIFKIPVEQAYANMENDFNIADGEGYFSYDNVEVYDSEDYYKSNIVIKIYTKKQ